MVLSWLAIAIATFLIGLAVNKLFPSDYRWFMQLRRPRWLTFERAIPVIWISIFICGITSATYIWQTEGAIAPLEKWLIMAGYAIVEVAVLLYTPIMTRSRNVRLGALTGAVGFFLGLGLTVQVWRISDIAGWLLMPYLLWSPVGTYVTWVMARLNPREL
ncbi:MAG: tryptophan-rich sensory protein [Pseudanabaenaceae cyanobacterium bins.39]|nr:tryptophan-rich sensory protein [Pseudanabaenaceae cyanobacterium bins.39]